MERALSITAASMVAIVVILGPAHLIAFNTSYHNKLFGNFEGAEQLKGAKELNKQIIGFLNYKNELPSELSENEKLHMIDVRNVILGFRILWILSLAAVLYFVLTMREKAVSYLNSGAKYSLICLILLAVLSIPFSSFFTWFHLVFFPQGNWQFPSNSILIMLYPQEFFQRVFIDILLLSAIFSSLLLLTTELIEKFYKLKVKSK